MGSSMDKQGAVPNGAEPPVILQPEEPCAAESAGSHTGDVGWVQLGCVAAVWLTISFCVSV